MRDEVVLHDELLRVDEIEAFLLCVHGGSLGRLLLMAGLQICTLLIAIFARGCGTINAVHHDLVGLQVVKYRTLTLLASNVCRGRQDTSTVRSVKFAGHGKRVSLLERALREQIVEELEVVTLAGIGSLVAHIGVRLRHLRLLVVRRIKHVLLLSY